MLEPQSEEMASQEYQRCTLGSALQFGDRPFLLDDHLGELLVQHSGVFCKRGHPGGHSPDLLMDSLQPHDIHL